MSGPDLAARRAAGRRRPPVPGRQHRRSGPARLAAAAAAALIPVALASCAKFDAALGQQWAVVNFRPNTSIATLLKIRAACSHVPNVQPEKLPKVHTAMNMVYALQYRTDHATNANLASLQECLQKFPAVTGIDFQDSGDSG
jgi:hypothetical protein